MITSAVIVAVLLLAGGRLVKKGKEIRVTAEDSASTEKNQEINTPE